MLLAAQKQGCLATEGVYGRIRHPQYIGFILVMLDLLLQWPTILTLAMFPLLVVMYVHLTHTEEAEANRAFGGAYARYAARVPGRVPHLRRPEAARKPS